MKYDWLQNIILFAGVDQESYLKAKGAIDNSNRSSLCVYSAVSMLFLVFLFLSSLTMGAIQTYRLLYLAAALFSGLTLVYGTLFYQRYPNLLLPVMYVFMAMLYTFGIVLGTASEPDALSVTFIVLLMAVPLLFTDRPVRMIALNLGAMIAFDVTILFLKTGDTLNVDMLNCTTFGLISCVVATHMMTVKVGRIVYSDRSDMLSRTDLLTGCKNRNCYEQEVSAYGRACTASLACIYVDVNGLHEMNDQHGHTAGDTMLKYVAAQMRQAFSDESTYRIGGDEFVSLICDDTQEGIEQRIDQVLAQVDAADYHIAIGYDLHRKNELDLIRLLHTAEERMYQSKKAYYEATGLPRRKRR